MLRIIHVEMLPLETKQSGDKLLPHSDLRGGGVFLEEVSRRRKRNRDILRWIFRKLEGVVGTGWSWLRIGTDGGHLRVR
jgi:hypothetical protein